MLQEVFTTVWHKAGQFDAGKAAAMTWMGMIARNRAIDSLRRRQTSPQTVSSVITHADDEETDMLNALPSDAPGPLDLLEQASEAMALQDCMAQLNKDQRQSLALAYYQGLSHSEVAEQLRQPLGTVKSWVRRGLQGLKNCLERASLALS